jgi:hypothetical protein
MLTPWRFTTERRFCDMKFTALQMRIHNSVTALDLAVCGLTAMWTGFVSMTKSALIETEEDNSCR